MSTFRDQLKEIGKITPDDGGKLSPFRKTLRDIGAGGQIFSNVKLRDGEYQGERIRRLKSERDSLQEDSQKKNSFKFLLKETVRPSNLAKGASKVGKTAVNDPWGTTQSAVSGMVNGLSFGALDYFQKKAYTQIAKDYGLNEEQAKQLADSVISESGSGDEDIRGGFKIGGMLGGYAAAEKALYSGIKYAAPTYIKNHAVAARFLSDLGVFNATGQLEETFKDPEERDRMKRLFFDTAAATTFFVGGQVYRKIRPTVFNKLGIKTSTANIPGVRSDADITKHVKDNLLAQVKYNSDEAGKILSNVDVSGVTSYKELEKLYKNALPKKLQTPSILNSIDNWIKQGDQFAKFNQELINTGLSKGLDTAAGEFAAGKAITDKAISKLRGGMKETLEVDTSTGKHLVVGVDDVNALKNYIKGSGNIDYKIVKTLGKNADGVKINARHEFNKKTGKHTIYATDKTTASSLAHELGHYYDTSLTKTTQGLARILPHYEANREIIEDALGAYAVERLGGKATNDAISTEIKKIISALKKETKILSAERRGGVAEIRPHEQFADAVSELLTKGAYKKAPVLDDLLKFLNKDEQAKLFGGVAEIRKFKNADEYISAQPVKETKIDGMDHRPSKSGESTNIENAAPDFYQHPEYYNHGGKSYDESQSVLMRIKDKPNADVTIYRASPKNELRTGDWVTFSKTYAKEQADRIGGKVHSFKVKAKDVQFAGDDINEMGYWGHSSSVKKELKEKYDKATKVIEKEVPKKLKREKPTRKMGTDPINAAAKTTDEELEVMVNTKIIPEMTQKYRVPKTNDEIIEASYSTDMTEEGWTKFLEERVGNLSEDTHAGIRMSFDKVKDLRDRLAGRSVDDLSSSEMAEFMKEYQQAVEMFEVTAGLRTELSNAFRTLGIATSPGENDALRRMVGEIQKALGKEGDDAFKLMQKARELQKQDIFDKYFSIWYPAILSGPKTQVRNIVGSAFNLATQTTATLFEKNTRREFLPRVLALIGGGKSAWKTAGQVFRREKSIYSKFTDEAPKLRELDFQGPFKFMNTLNYVGRSLDAADSFFSTLAKDAEVAAMRVGKYHYGLEKNDQIIKKIDESISTLFAQEATYRNKLDKSAVGFIGGLAQQAKQSDIQAIKATSTFVVPFVRTVANVTDRKIDYIPLISMFRVRKNSKFLQERLRQVQKETGLDRRLVSTNPETKAAAERASEIILERLQHIQMGRMYMGISAITTLLPFAMTGLVSGSGPKDPRERKTLMSKGWRPNSIIIGNVALPYQNLGPLAGVFSVVGNMHDSVKYNHADDKTITGELFDGVMMLASSEMNQSFVSGIQNVFELFSPYSYREPSDILADMAVSGVPVPAAWTQSVDIFKTLSGEPKKETKTMLDKLGAKVGIDNHLEPRLDVFGRPTSSDLIWGLTPKIINTNDPVLNWMDDNNIFIGKPNKKQTIRSSSGEKREMTPSEYTQYLEESGQETYERLKELIKRKSFNNLSEDGKKKVIQGIVQGSRAKAKGKIKF